MQEVEDDWKDLTRRLKFHLTVIEGQTDSLQEYQEYQPLDKIKTPLPLPSEIKKLLQAYVKLVPLLRS